MNTILITAAIIFTVVSFYFFLNKAKFNSDFPWLVSFITVISYLVMSMNLNATMDPTAMLWTRWVGYGISCTLLTASMTALFGITGNKKTVALLSTALIMLTGVLAAVATTTTFVITFFALGMVPFISLISIFRKNATEKNKYVLNYLYYGWMAFPVIFILSPETFGFVSSLSAILLAYLLADIITKIVFYLHIQKIKQ